MSNWWDDNDQSKKLRDAVKQMTQPFSELSSLKEELRRMQTIYDSSANNSSVLQAARALGASTTIRDEIGAQARYLKAVEATKLQLPQAWAKTLAELTTSQETIKSISANFLQKMMGSPPDAIALGAILDTSVQRALRNQEIQRGDWASFDSWKSLADQLAAATNDYAGDVAPSENEVDEATLEIDTQLSGWIESSQTPNEFFADFSQRAHAAGPVIGAIMMFLLMQVVQQILGIWITAAYTHVTSNETGPRSSQVSAHEKRDVRQESSFAVITGQYPLLPRRVVTATLLVVHASPKQKGPKLGALSLGAVVVVLTKQRDWTLVQYVDAGSQPSKNGWVLTRYLAKMDE